MSTSQRSRVPDSKTERELMFLTSMVATFASVYLISLFDLLISLAVLIFLMKLIIHQQYFSYYTIFAIGIALVGVKGFFSEYSGLAISSTDYRILADLLLYFSTLLILFRFLKNRIQLCADELINTAFTVFLIWHILNYFLAGTEKISLLGLDYIFNPTNYIIVSALLSEKAPFVSLMNIDADSILSVPNIFVIIINILVLSFQLASPAALISKNTYVLFLIFCDIFHLAVFFSTGIFFYKWIFLNLVLIFFIQRGIIKFNGYIFRWPTLIGVLTVYCVAIIPRLGWIDTNFSFYPRISLIDGSGISQVVGAEYFGPLSLPFAQGRVGTLRPELVGTFGASKSIYQVDCSSDWADQVRISKFHSDSSVEQYLKKAVKLRNFIEKYSLSFKISHYLYPHHIVGTEPISSSGNFDEKDIRLIGLNYTAYCYVDGKVYEAQIGESIYEISK